MKLIELGQIIVPTPRNRSIKSILAEHPNKKFMSDNQIYDCSGSFLDSLEGAPESTPRDFYCLNNNLTSLEFAPRVVNGDFDCSTNPDIKSLKNIHKQILTIKGTFYADNNWKMNSNLLGLLLIDGLKGAVLTDKNIQKIMWKYFEKPNKKLAMLQCQQELIEAGFEDAAQL